MQSVNVWLQPQANKLFDCLIALGGTGTSVYYFFTNQLFCCFVHFFTIQLFCFVVLFMCFYLPIVLLFCLLIYQQARSFEFPFNVFCSQQFFLFFKVFTSFVVCSDMSIMPSTDQLITGQISGACFAD